MTGAGRIAQKTRPTYADGFLEIRTKQKPVQLSSLD